MPDNNIFWPLYSAKPKWLLPCEKCGKFTSARTGGTSWVEWETGSREAALCKDHTGKITESGEGETDD